VAAQDDIEVLAECQAELAVARVEAGVVGFKQVRQSTLPFRASFDQATGRFFIATYVEVWPACPELLAKGSERH